MKFVPSDQLKVGMRLAKPIYNKKGVMLYERDSKLTGQGIVSIQNFGLIGIYILEPAEPLPPLSEEDREFERYQTVAVFKLKEILDKIKAGNMPMDIEMFAAEILKRYGSLKEKVNFMQNLRSNEDNVYKHSLNVAILSALITGKMTFTYEEQKNIVIAALLHDIGSLDISDALLSKPESQWTDEDIAIAEKCRDNGYRILRDLSSFDSEIMKNVSYLLRGIKDAKSPGFDTDKKPKDMAVEVLKVAYMYDVMTAMKYGDEPHSEIAAFKYLRHPRNKMSQQVVTAMTYAINIVPTGCTVQFENGRKGIVLVDNPDDILRPFILSFYDNQIYNLADGKIYEEYQIQDVLKTLDNRYIMTDEYQKYLDRLETGSEKVLEVGKPV